MDPFSNWAPAVDKGIMFVVSSIKNKTNFIETAKNLFNIEESESDDGVEEEDDEVLLFHKGNHFMHLRNW